MAPLTPPPEDDQAVESAASEWLARGDRGLTAAEQDAYLAWLSRSPAHAAAVKRLENAWRALDQLSEWRPSDSPRPNPDLLAVPRRRAWRWLAPLAAAAAIAVAGAFWSGAVFENPQRPLAIIHPGPERLVLEDGSIVDLNAGAQVDVRFTPAERRVALVRGEAHFTVAKNPARPFVVRVDKFAVRAVGTAFDVSVDRRALSVLVTEGRVRIEDVGAPAGGDSGPARELPHLIAGQQAVIAVAADDVWSTATATVEVRDVTPAEIERALSWQGLRLEFVEMRLGDVVAEFNRYNLRKLKVADAHTAAILVGGNFRADNIDAFVRLLELGFDVSASSVDGEIVLRRGR